MKWEYKKRNKDLESTEINLFGFKHSTVPLLCAILARGTRATLKNIPDLEDVKVLTEVMVQLNCSVEYSKEDSKLILDCTDAKYNEIDQALLSKVHGTIYLIPAFLARFGFVSPFTTGGCPLENQSRPINHILEVLYYFGAKKEGNKITLRNISYVEDVDIEGFYENSSLENTPYASGITKSILILAYGLKKNIKIFNYYTKRDVLDLVDFITINNPDSSIKNDCLDIRFSKDETNQNIFSISSDSIGFVTYSALSYLLRQTIIIKCNRIEALIRDVRDEVKYLEHMGFKFEFSKTKITINYPDKIKVIDLTSTPSGMYSDSVPILSILNIISKGNFQIIDTVWRNRNQYLEELKHFKISYNVDNTMTSINAQNIDLEQYPQKLHGKDLRSVVALILIAIYRDINIEILGIEHIKRGYQDFFQELEKFGIQGGLIE